MSSTAPGFEQVDFAVDNLFYGAEPVITESATIAAGEEISRGAVLGKVTEGGALKLSAAGAADGSQTPYAIAADDVDASEEAKRTVVYVKGHFNSRALSLGTGHTVESIKAGLRTLGIYMSESADPTDPVAEETGS